MVSPSYVVYTHVFYDAIIGLNNNVLGGTTSIAHHLNNNIALHKGGFPGNGKPPLATPLLLEIVDEGNRSRHSIDILLDFYDFQVSQKFTILRSVDISLFGPAAICRG